MKEFVQKNKVPICLSLLFSLVCFGFMLTHHTVGIDEETWLAGHGDIAGWLYQGRFGIWMFDAIFMPNGNYIPFLWDFLAVILWMGAGVIFAYCYCGLDEKSNRVEIFFFCSYFASVPFIVGEILSFSMFNLQISLAMVCVASALFNTINYIRYKKKTSMVITWVLLTFAFSVFQAMICVYVTAITALCLFEFLEKHAVVKTMLSGAVICCIAVVSYYLLNSLIMAMIGTDSYLTDSYWGWNDKKGVMHALFFALANIVRVSFAIPIGDVEIYGGGVIRFLTILFLIGSVVLLGQQKGVRNKGVFILLSAALIIAPFSLYVVLGTYRTQGRMLLGLALAGAVELVILLRFFREKRYYLGICLISLLFLFYNACNMNLLYYYQYVAYNYDKITVSRVMQDIEKECSNWQNKPVVFVGKREMEVDFVKTSANVGASMFEWDDGNTDRIINFIETEGYVLKVPDISARIEASEYSKEMDEWPNKGSIKETQNVIIVKFSKPTEKWYLSNGIN